MDFAPYEDYADYGMPPEDGSLTTEELMEKYGITEEQLAAMYEDYGQESHLDTLGGEYGVQEAVPRVFLHELADMCIWPSISSLWSQLAYILLACLIARILSILLRQSPTLTHVSIAVSGIIAGRTVLAEQIHFLLLFTLLSYALLWASSGLPGRPSQIFALLVCLLCVAVGELWMDDVAWQSTRGPAMIMMMKAISVGCDMHTHGPAELPSPVAYASYMLNPGTILFGPWLSLRGYRRSVEHGAAAESVGRVGEAFALVRSLVLSIACLLVSTCALSWIIRDEWGAWPTAFRDAQSFRFSHYFVAYMSAFTCMLLGVGVFVVPADKEKEQVTKGLVVSLPLAVEFPRSFADIVTAWDLPMHHWLKNYVFHSVSHQAGKFAAVMATYAASALLHGLNFQIAAVLFSLGAYSYVEVMLRAKLGKGFSACVLARKCRPGCDHRRGASHPAVIVFNFAFMLLNMFHLAYLGLMFDNSDAQETGYSMQHTAAKWAKLGYMSHIVAAATYLFYLAIK